MSLLDDSAHEPALLRWTNAETECTTRGGVLCSDAEYCSESASPRYINPSISGDTGEMTGAVEKYAPKSDGTNEWVRSGDKRKRVWSAYVGVAGKLMKVAS